MQFRRDYLKIDSEIFFLKKAKRGGGNSSYKNQNKIKKIFIIKSFSTFSVYIFCLKITGKEFNNVFSHLVTVKDLVRVDCYSSFKLTHEN